MSFLIICAIVVAVIIVLYMISPFVSPKITKLNGAHILITGGSSGIGKALAAEVVKRGAHVTLLARNQGRLAAAKEYLEQFMKDKTQQKVVCISVDLVKDYAAVEKAVKQATDLLGPVTILINCAGYATVRKFEDLEIEDFRKLMDANYIGSVYATRAVISEMKRQNCGRIVFTSSQAGQIGVFGYTAYSPSKFALRGFAEALQMEVKPYNIRVTLAFPPDTDTPGYVQENLGKPQETKLISEASGLFQPEYVAKCILDDVTKGKFLSPVGLDGWMLGHLTSGMCPATTITEALQQITLMGVFRAIALFYISSFDSIVRKCKVEREERENAVQNIASSSS